MHEISVLKRNCDIMRKIKKGKWNKKQPQKHRGRLWMEGEGTLKSWKILALCATKHMKKRIIILFASNYRHMQYFKMIYSVLHRRKKRRTWNLFYFSPFFASLWVSNLLETFLLISPFLIKPIITDNNYVCRNIPWNKFCMTRLLKCHQMV
jgi:hypothetical protein